MALLTNLKPYREKYNLKQADLAELVAFAGKPLSILNGANTILR